jgi:hypothetical protein
MDIEAKRFPYKMNKHHLDLFECFVQQFAKYFDISKSWEWAVIFGADTDKRATVAYGLGSRSAVIELTQENDGALLPLTPRELARTAAHEVIHVLLAPMSHPAECGSLKGIDFNETEHPIVHVLTVNAMDHIYDDMAELLSGYIAKAFPEPETED